MAFGEIRDGHTRGQRGLGFHPMGEQTHESATGQAARRSDDVPRTYLLWSVLATALLFLPLGLIALFFSIRTNVLMARGAVEPARRASRWAFTFAVAATIVGALTYVLLVGALLALGAFSGN